MPSSLQNPIRITAALLLLAMIAACQPYTLVKSGVRTPVADGMTVAPQKSWNQLGAQFTGGLNDHVEVWTADSQILNELVFVGGLDDGEKLFRNAASAPAFSADATVVDLADFARKTLAASAQSTPKELETKPIQFLGNDGVQTEFDLPYKDGTPGRALAAAAIKNGKLYMIIWRAVGDLYYNGRKSEVEEIIKTARIGIKA